jgi:hypothetical protein
VSRLEFTLGTLSPAKDEQPKRSPFFRSPSNLFSRPLTDFEAAQAEGAGGDVADLLTAVKKELQAKGVTKAVEENGVRVRFSGPSSDFHSTSYLTFIAAED